MNFCQKKLLSKYKIPHKLQQSAYEATFPRPWFGKLPPGRFVSITSRQIANRVVCCPLLVVCPPIWEAWEVGVLVLVFGGVVVVIGPFPPLPLPPGLVVIGTLPPLPPLPGLVVIGVFAKLDGFLTPE